MRPSHLLNTTKLPFPVWNILVWNIQENCHLTKSKIEKCLQLNSQLHSLCVLVLSISMDANLLSCISETLPELTDFEFQLVGDDHSSENCDVEFNALTKLTIHLTENSQCQVRLSTGKLEELWPMGYSGTHVQRNNFINKCTNLIRLMLIDTWIDDHVETFFDWETYANGESWQSSYEICQNFTVFNRIIFIWRFDFTISNNLIRFCIRNSTNFASWISVQQSICSGIICYCSWRWLASNEAWTLSWLSSTHFEISIDFTPWREPVLTFRMKKWSQLWIQNFLFQFFFLFKEIFHT